MVDRKTIENDLIETNFTDFCLTAGIKYTVLTKGKFYMKTLQLPPSRDPGGTQLWGGGDIRARAPK